jgi:molecular chaperone GrpE
MPEQKIETPVEPTPGDEQESEAVDKDLLQLYEQFQKATEERDQIKDQLLRTMADFQNFRKRVLDEKRLIEERANERFVTELLPVLDNFERGLAVIEQGGTLESLVEGVKAIDRQLRSVLESQKVIRIVSVGQPFDPDQHEALATVESAEHEDGTVIDEIEPGYKLGDRVIRPARVRVSKKP